MFTSFEVEGYIKEIDLCNIGFYCNLQIIVPKDIAKFFSDLFNLLWFFIDGWQPIVSKEANIATIFLSKAE